MLQLVVDEELDLVMDSDTVKVAAEDALPQLLMAAEGDVVAVGVEEEEKEGEGEVEALKLGDGEEYWEGVFDEDGVIVAVLVISALVMEMDDVGEGLIDEMGAVAVGATWVPVVERLLEVRPEAVEKADFENMLVVGEVEGELVPVPLRLPPPRYRLVGEIVG